MEMESECPEVFARMQTISNVPALKRHFFHLFTQGQPRYADPYDVTAESWTLFPDMVSRFVEGWQLSVLGERKRSIIAMTLILSMPAGTDPIKNKIAALAFARRKFGDREFVFVAGEHSGPFVKFLVQYRNSDDNPLSHGPAALRHYRETFAEELCAQGEAAFSTTRINRGSPFAETQNAYKARERISARTRELPITK